MTRFKRGCLRRKGKNWVFRFYVIRPADGKRVENTKVVGSVKQFTKTTAWEEVERLGFAKLINNPTAGKVKFNVMAGHFKANALEKKGLVSTKAPGTIANYTHIVDDYLVPRGVSGWHWKSSRWKLSSGSGRSTRTRSSRGQP